MIRAAIACLSVLIFLSGCAPMAIDQTELDDSPRGDYAASGSPVGMNGENEAVINMAKAYITASPPYRDANKGLTMLTELANQGDGQAMFVLGRLYSEGKFLRKDLKKSRLWFAKGASAGHLEAGIAFAEMCQEGQGGAKDSARAFEVYTKAIEKYPGDHYRLQTRHAHWALGDMYFEGVGTTQDYAKAMVHYKAAKKKGLFGREYRIAYMYEHGLGTPQDGIKAASWYREAVSKRNYKALKPLNRLMKGMTPKERKIVNRGV